MSVHRTLIFLLIISGVLAHTPFEEEFEQIIEPIAPAKNETISDQKHVSQIQEFMKSHPTINRHVQKFVNGGLEYFLIIAFSVYIVNYLVGIKRNTTISQNWLDRVRSVIFNNFAIIGTEGESLKNETMIQFEDTDSNTFKIYASGRENVHYAHFTLELKKRQDFITMIVSFFMCRNLFRSPIATDSLWIELPIERPKGAPDLISEVLIVPKKGYYLDQIKKNMLHIDHLLKPRIPNYPCQSTLKQRNYPLVFLAESQEIIDLLFGDQRI